MKNFIEIIDGHQRAALINVNMITAVTDVSKQFDDADGIQTWIKASGENYATKETYAAIMRKIAQAID